MDVRLAHCGPPESLASGLVATPLGSPALLVSYVYLRQFLSNRHRYAYRDWVLDSGAFSAHNCGKDVSLSDYIQTCKELLANDATLTEVFALDVIGDPKQSRVNCQVMWDAGIHAIPCFHYGEPWDDLVGMARDYPKIALGGVAARSATAKLKWAEQCFARVWPKPIHGFAFGGEKAVMHLPWHSVDSTSWEIGPCKYGRWRSFGQLSVRGSRQNLRAEVEWYLKLEQRAQARWRREMELLRTTGPEVRLAMNRSAGLTR